MIFINVNLNYEKANPQKTQSSLKGQISPLSTQEPKKLAELANVLDFNPMMTSRWKAEFLETLTDTFEKTDDNDSKELIPRN